MKIASRKSRTDLDLVDFDPGLVLMMIFIDWDQSKISSISAPLAIITYFGVSVPIKLLFTWAF